MKEEITEAHNTKKRDGQNCHSIGRTKKKIDENHCETVLFTLYYSDNNFVLLTLRRQ